MSDQALFPLLSAFLCGALSGTPSLFRFVRSPMNFRFSASMSDFETIFCANWRLVSGIEITPALKATIDELATSYANASVTACNWRWPALDAGNAWISRATTFPGAHSTDRRHGRAVIISSGTKSSAQERNVNVSWVFCYH